MVIRCGYFAVAKCTMTPHEKYSRKRAIRRAPPRKRVRTHMKTLLMFSVLFAAVVTITPTTTSAEAETIAPAAKAMDPATLRLGKKHTSHRTADNNYYGYHATPVYYGNWGFAPGGYYWDPNYLWRRSRGFWDTNSPACPFRSC
jgi:hypothetical protein